jgi:hypothetical protein
MRDDELTPQGVRGREVSENLNDSLKDSQPVVGFGDGKPKPPAGGRRASTNIPELGPVLRGSDQFIPSGEESTNCRANDGVLGVGPFHEPQENAAVGQDEHLVVVVVDVGPREVGREDLAGRSG